MVFRQFDPEETGEYDFTADDDDSDGYNDFALMEYRESGASYGRRSNEISQTAAMKEYHLTIKDMKTLTISGNFMNPHPGGAPGKLYLREDCRVLSEKKVKKKEEKEKVKEEKAREKNQRMAERERKRQEKALSKSPPTSTSKSPRKRGASSRVAPYDNTPTRGRPSNKAAKLEKLIESEDAESVEDSENDTDGDDLEDSDDDREVEEKASKIEPGSERRSERRTRRVNYAGLD